MWSHSPCRGLPPISTPTTIPESWARSRKKGECEKAKPRFGRREGVHLILRVKCLDCTVDCFLGLLQARSPVNTHEQSNLQQLSQHFKVPSGFYDMRSCIRDLRASISILMTCHKTFVYTRILELVSVFSEGTCRDSILALCTLDSTANEFEERLSVWKRLKASSHLIVNTAWKKEQSNLSHRQREYNSRKCWVLLMPSMERAQVESAWDGRRGKWQMLSGDIGPAAA